MNKDEIMKAVQEEMEKFMGEPNTPVTQSKMNSILLPMIRRVIPTVIAHDIVSVQPMTMPTSTFVKYKTIDKHDLTVPDNYVAINVDREVAQWIETQPLHMWKHGEMKVMPQFYDQYIVSEELLSWITLKWS